MNVSQIKLRVLEKYYPDECEIVGSSNIEAITNGSHTVIETSHGSNMAIMEIVAVVVAVVSFIDALLSVIERLTKIKSGKLTAEEVVVIVRKEVKPEEEIDEDNLEEICQYILTMIQQEN